MKGDFSRVTWRPEKHYRSVRMQQGRVQLDADWNEQQDITAYRVDAEAFDGIGQHGGPIGTAGFALVTRLEDLPPSQKDAAAALFPLKAGNFVISGGHYYVDGMLCENDAPCSYVAQPDLPGVKPLAKGVYLAFLDVWEQHVTALEDPDIREVALGGPDTATRSRLVWQVKVVPVNDAAANCGSRIDAFTAATKASTGRLSARAQPSVSSDDPCIVDPGAGYRRLENQLYRVEIHDGGEPGVATFKWSRDNGSVAAAWLVQDGNELTVSSAGRDRFLGFTRGDWVELTDDSRELNGQPGTLVQLTGVEGDVLTIAVPDDSSGAINRSDFPLHPRVRRWHTPGESGSVVVTTPAANAGFLEIEGGVQVKFEPGTYATGDYWLIPARTATGNVDPLSTQSQPPAGIRHHYCRLGLLSFDGSAFTSIKDCRRLFPAVTDLTSLFMVGGDGQDGAPGQTLLQPLQAGVANGLWPVRGATVRFQVTLGAGRLQGSPSLDVTTGADGVASCKFTLDSSTASQQVTATLLDPSGAAVHLPARFNAALSTTVVSPGVRIVGVVCDTTPVENDTDLSNRKLASGLSVMCDADVAPESVSRTTCALIVELPFPLGESDTELWGNKGIVGHTPIVIAGTVSAGTKSIAWAPSPDASEWLQHTLFPVLRKKKIEARLLVRLTLRGHFIWNAKDAEQFLDGEVLGIRQLSGRNVRTGLRLPTGDGRSGGTFEMWFWLVDEIAVSISLSSPSVRVTGSAIVTATVEGTADTRVEMSVNAVVGGNATVGTIVPSTERAGEWIYTAPSRIPSPNPVDITATSLADRTRTSSASLLIMGRIIIDPGPVVTEPVVRPTETPGRGGRVGRRKKPER